VLPAIIDKAAAFRVDSASYRTSHAITEAMKSASPEIKEFATPLLKQTYTSLPGVITEPNTGAVMNRASATIRSRIGTILQQVPTGDEYVRRLPRTTLASHVSGKDSDMYAYSGTFTPNPAAIGTWAWAIWPAANKPDEIDDRIHNFLNPRNGTAPEKIERPKDVIQFLDDGRVAKSRYYRNYFWSGDMLVGINDDQAVKFEVRTVGGRDFLIVERGGFNAIPQTEDEATAKPAPDWHCGYHIYVRQ